MKDFIFYMLGCFISAIVATVGVTYDRPTKEQIGYTLTELKEMKAECEKELPRSTECSIVVYYLPQAELEETE